MSWTQRVRHPKDVLQPGDRVRVAITSVVPDKRKLGLSLKALAADPWNGITERYTVESLVSGAVTRLTDFGAFIQLEDGVEGLVHISQLSDQRVRTVKDVLHVGQVVQVRVLGVDAAQRRISLSVKAAKTPEPVVSEALPAESAAQPAAPPKKLKERKKPLRGGLTW
jgi:small subunit ribosomal protein S1